MRCWKFKPEDRPRFAELVSSLSTTLETMIGYMDVSALGDSTEASSHRAISHLNDTHSMNEEHSPCQTSSGYSVKSDDTAPTTPTGSTIAVSGV